MFLPCTLRSQIVALTSLVLVPYRQAVPDSVTVVLYFPLVGPVRLTAARRAAPRPARGASR